MKNIEPLDNADLQHVELFFYLIPVVGFFPSLWTLYRHGGSRELPAGRSEQLAVSRLSVTLAFSWLLGYLLLSFGAAETSEFLTLRLLMLNSLLTSGYFLVSIWLMVRLWQRKSPRLPGFSHLAERVRGFALIKEQRAGNSEQGKPPTKGGV